LYRIRNASRKRNIWIDSICINHTDILEKNKQLEIIGNIYLSAETVLVWLGEPEDPEQIQEGCSIVQQVKAPSKFGRKKG
jgi:hypothetical protein